MPSLNDDLRRRTQALVLEMPVSRRIALALSLGDDDLMLFVRASGLSPDEARQRLRASRARGRAPSRAASFDRP